MDCQRMDRILLGFNKKYLNLCSEDELKFYGFGVIDDRTFIFGWTIPLIFYYEVTIF